MRLLSSLTAVLMVLVLAAGALAQPADDEWVDSLVMARDRLDSDIALLDGELTSIAERIASDDWRIDTDTTGKLVELDLRTLDRYVPLAVVFSQHPGILRLELSEVLWQADPAAWGAVMAIGKTGDLEGKTVDEVIAMVRRANQQSADDKRAVYTDWKQKVQAERDGLAELRDEIQRELDAIANAAGASASPEASLEPSPLPSLAPSPDVTPEPSLEPSPEPCATSGENAIDVLSCDWDATPEPTLMPEPLGDPGIDCAGEFADALEAPYTSLSVAQIGACFDDCQDWISWHGSFGDTLPGWCSEPEDSPLAMWEGQWPTNRGVLTLTAEAGRLIGEFESGADSSLAGAQVVLEPGEENRYSAVGRWSNTEGRYECADEFGAEPGHWGEIWLDLGANDLLFGGFNHCNERGGGWIDMD